MFDVQIAQVDGFRAYFSEIEDNYSVDANSILAWLDSNGLDITFENLQSYLADIKGCSPATYNKRVAAIRNRLKKALEDQNLTVNQTVAILNYINRIKPVKIQYRPAKYLSEAEVQKLISNTKPRTSLIIEFLWITGCRISEAVNIEQQHIKDESGAYSITVIGKGSKARIVRAPHDLIARIKSEFADTENKKLFSGLRKEAASMQIKRSARRILKKEISAHTLRHSFATDKIAKTKNLSAVSKYLGHASIGTTSLLYDHNILSDADLFQ
ncbi:tyrosine-type recombinase/integrase [Spirochaeta africana]|uniref:Site-specific recombinase XerD n=1 Tax=Spirochaeta africana (strain ATCC 700263 / DSM 8902 / Z-7692) TaxID=889378 RepID=H9UIU9_SPIAZ|nr:tyrosine-type recombinase/integrase [Spirochaeta africana]AFG37442.1 site-specific recombinase XerD [Spirochaeta africana DSM 8902]